VRQVNLLFGWLAPLLLAQQGGPVNLNFQETEGGPTPKAWYSITEPGYSTATSNDCRTPKSRCALLRYEGRSDPRDFGWLQQTFLATALRGKNVRYRAWLRLQDRLKGRAQLFLRVDRSNGDVGFHDYSHDRPVPLRDWTAREIVGRIDADAVNITIGLMLGGRGTAFIADQQFESLDRESALETRNWAVSLCFWRVAIDDMPGGTARPQVGRDACFLRLMDCWDERSFATGILDLSVCLRSAASLASEVEFPHGPSPIGGASHDRQDHLPLPHPGKARRGRYGHRL
jgi:hypothetical protein